MYDLLMAMIELLIIEQSLKLLILWMKPDLK